jgi:hypothetical protein
MLSQDVILRKLKWGNVMTNNTRQKSPNETEGDTSYYNVTNFERSNVASP